MVSEMSEVSAIVIAEPVCTGRREWNKRFGTAFVEEGVCSQKVRTETLRLLDRADKHWLVVS
jgi:hypothetical protein